MSREEHKPVFEHVALWNWFPDIASVDEEDRECGFQLHRWTRSRLRRAVKEEGFWEESVRAVLAHDPGTTKLYGEFIRGLAAFEMGDPAATDDDRYYVWEFRGAADANEMAKVLPSIGSDAQELYEALGIASDGEDVEGRDAGEAEMAGIDPLAEVNVVCWFTEGICLYMRPELLDSGELPWSMWSMDPDETSPYGPGVAAMGRHAQAVVTASWRLANESGALSGGPMWIVDWSVEPDDGVFEVRPRKIWRRTQGGATDAKGLEPVEINPQIEGALAIYDRARELFNEETMVMPFMPSELGRGETPPGMTLRSSAINLEYRDVIRGFDMGVSIPVIRRLMEWNEQFGPEEAKGDAEIVALGASALLVREVRTGQLMTLANLAATNPEVGDWIRMGHVTREIVHSMQLGVDEAVYSDAQGEANRQARLEAMGAEQQAEQQGKVELERTRQEGVQVVEQGRAQVERERLASQERLAQYKAQVAMETARLKASADERRVAVETALKRRYGTAI